jgi:hypothetical protein
MLHAAVIALSSFLLFLVQPLIARLILPWFGGTAAVWTTCMLFFQTVLLAGYAYAHATNARLAPRTQALVHTILLVAALAMLPIAPDERWKPLGAEEPVSHILVLLVASVGLPYFPAVGDEPVAAGVVRAGAPGRGSVPALRDLESRIGAGAGRLIRSWSSRISATRTRCGSGRSCSGCSRCYARRCRGSGSGAASCRRPQPPRKRNRRRARTTCCGSRSPPPAR